MRHRLEGLLVCTVLATATWGWSGTDAAAAHGRHHHHHHHAARRATEDGLRLLCIETGEGEVCFTAAEVEAAELETLAEGA